MKKKLTVVIVGHLIDNFIFYLKYLIHSLPEILKECEFIIHYDNSDNYNETKSNNDIKNLLDSKGINYKLSFGFGGLISSIKNCITKVETDYYLFLEHDWVFLEKDNIDFSNVIKVFDKYNFVNSVWFSKDDNQQRGFEICEDSQNNITPFTLETRINELNLITTCRWSNNPVIFRTKKMKEWFDNFINNEHVDKINQRQGNVEEKMIMVYRDQISKNKWEDIRDDWGTYLYGNLFEGPYVGHTDASKRYQGSSKSQPEINGENYIKKFQNV